MQAILITAYKNFHHIKYLIDFFDDDFVFYIHICQKSIITKSELENITNDKRVIFITRKYSGNWGGLNQLESILTLAEEAIKNQDIEYVHLMSGQDFPIRSCERIKYFLQENKGKQFIRYAELPIKDWKYNGGLGRLTYYHFYDLFNHKSMLGAMTNRALLLIQKIIRINRNISCLPKLYGGSAWWTLSLDCLKYIVAYKKINPLFWEKFKHTFAPGEMYIHTIIMNSPFKENVVNNDLRFIEWVFRNGNSPANLDESDYDRIIESNKLFARKIEYPISEKLMSRLRKLGESKK